MPYIYSGTTKQLGIAHTNYVVAIKVDMAQADNINKFQLLEVVEANAQGKFSFDFGETNPGRLLIGAVDDDDAVKLDCIFHDWVNAVLDGGSLGFSILEFSNQDLVVAYSMDNVNGSTLTDDSGNGNDATVSPEVLEAIGDNGLCLDFPNDGAVTFSSASLAAVSNFTISAFLYCDSLPLQGGVICEEYATTSDPIQFSMAFSSTNSPSVTGSHIYIGIYDGSDWVVAQYDQLFPTGEWVHVSGVYDGTDLILYINSVEVARTALAAGLPPSGGDYLIGEDWAARAFDGKIDQLRAFDRALTADEISQLYAGEEPSDSILSSDHENLIAMYTMDDVNGSTLIDETGNNNGVVSGAFQEEGFFGSSLNFDGINDSVDVGSGNFGINDFSVSWWMKTTSVENDVVIECDGNTGWSIQTSPSNNGLIAINKGGTSPQAISSNPINDGQWHHVCVSTSGNSVDIYIDGIDDTDLGSVAGSTSFPTGNLSIGARNNTVANYAGNIDQIRVFDRVLTKQEVAILATEKVRPNINRQSDLAAAYTMANISGNTLGDDSLNSHDGTITGATQVTGPSPTMPALSFDGIDDNVKMDSVAALLSSPPISVAFWFRVEETPTGTETMFQIGGEATTSDNANVVNINVYPEGNIGVYNQYPSSGTERSTAVNLDDGQWHHLVFSTDGSNKILFVDGKLDYEIVNDVLLSGAQRATIGAEYDSGAVLSDFFNGDISDLRLFNRALTPREAAQLYVERFRGS